MMVLKPTMVPIKTILVIQYKAQAIQLMIAQMPHGQLLIVMAMA